MLRVYTLGPGRPRPAEGRGALGCENPISTKEFGGYQTTVSDDPGALAFSAGLQPGEEPVYLLADDLLAF